MTMIKPSKTCGHCGVVTDRVTLIDVTTNIYLCDDCYALIYGKKKRIERPPKHKMIEDAPGAKGKEKRHYYVG